MSKTIINTVSYPKEMQVFLDENPDLSLSKIVQAGIIQIRANRKHNFEEIEKFKRVNAELQKRLLEATDYIEKLKNRIAREEEFNVNKRKFF